MQLHLAQLCKTSYSCFVVACNIPYLTHIFSMYIYFYQHVENCICNYVCNEMAMFNFMTCVHFECQLFDDMCHLNTF